MRFRIVVNTVRNPPSKKRIPRFPAYSSLRISLPEAILHPCNRYLSPRSLGLTALTTSSPGPYGAGRTWLDQSCDKRKYAAGIRQNAAQGEEILPRWQTSSPLWLRIAWDAVCGMGDAHPLRFPTGFTMRKAGIPAAPGKGSVEPPR